MNIKIVYSETQLEEAVKFITKHNVFMKGDSTRVHQSILENLPKMKEALKSQTYYLATMGYVLLAEEVYEESIDSDDNIVKVSILVDPAVSIYDFTEKIIIETME